MLVAYATCHGVVNELIVLEACLTQCQLCETLSVRVTNEINSLKVDKTPTALLQTRNTPSLNQTL